MVCRSDGSVWFTDPPFGRPGMADDPDRELDFSGVFRARCRRRVVLIDDALEGPNGIAFSPDERTLYVGNWDLEHKVVVRYELSATTARCSTGDVFYDMTDAPGEDAIDGIKVDVRATCTSAGPAASGCCLPPASALGCSNSPRTPHNLAFGGERRRDLYVTALTSVYRLRTAVPGINPSPRGAHDEQGPGARTDFPDFTLPDENGVRHRLSTLQGEDMLVLHLSRGEHCPRERMHHRELLRFHEWCDVGIAQLVSILPHVLHDTYKMRIATGAHWTFLADEELEVRTALEIDEYTDIHHDYAVVPHTLILSPGLRDREGLRRLLVLGAPVARAALARPAGDPQEDQGRLRPDAPRARERRTSWLRRVRLPSRADEAG